MDLTLILILLTPLIPLVLYGVSLAWVGHTIDGPIKQPCLHCGEPELQIAQSGKWDGITPDGKRVGGSYSYAHCKHCSALCENYNHKWELVEEERAKALLEIWEEEKERDKRIEEKTRAYNARRQEH